MKSSSGRTQNFGIWIQIIIITFLIVASIVELSTGV